MLCYDCTLCTVLCATVYVTLSTARFLASPALAFQLVTCTRALQRTRSRATRVSLLLRGSFCSLCMSISSNIVFATWKVLFSYWKIFQKLLKHEFQELTNFLTNFYSEQSQGKIKLKNSIEIWTMNKYKFVLYKLIFIKIFVLYKFILKDCSLFFLFSVR